MSDVAKKVETLMEAMPYLEKYQGKVIVIKYGGNAMINEELKDAVMHDVVLLKLLGMKPVLSHGHKRSEELGFVGDIDYVNADAINAMLDAGFIPVIAPVGTDGQGNTYNINGDTAAGKLASALGAEKLVILTDIEGLCNDIKVRDVISYLNIQDVKALKDKGTIAGGMIPKVDCCVEAIEEGVTSVHITPYSTRPSPPKAPAPRSAPHSRALASNGKKYIKF